MLLPMKGWLRWFALLGLVLSLVGCDHVTKRVAKNELENAAAYPLVARAFELRYAENRDIAFNGLSFVPQATRTVLILIGGLSALVALGFALSGARGSPRRQLALCLILAGALGNLCDRVFYGYVIDFVHLRHWPVFNLADVYVTLGAAALLVFRRTAQAAPS